MPPLKCAPTCTNDFFRKYNMDNTQTDSCSDINPYATIKSGAIAGKLAFPTCHGSKDCPKLIVNCTGAYSDTQKIKCTWNDYTNKCMDCFN